MKPIIFVELTLAWNKLPTFVGLASIRAMVRHEKTATTVVSFAGLASDQDITVTETPQEIVALAQDCMADLLDRMYPRHP